MPFFENLSDAEKTELWSVLALRHTQGIGPRRAKRLVEHYGSASSAVEAGRSSSGNWPREGLVNRDIAQRFASEQWRPGAMDEWRAIRQSGCGFLVWAWQDYPPQLREIPDAPLLLYHRGDLSLLRGPSVAIVGARDCTREGLAVAAFFSRDLSGAGVTVISGLAKGIDRAAHLGGLEGPGGTIAVLGTGIDVRYPLCNADLHERLEERALLISEFAPGTAPNSRNFPVRNRLISALSQGVLVVEAAARSGSLITAHLALEQNKDVFAVPGHTLASVSKGCRELIRRGAKPVFTADDILADLAPLLTLEARKALEARHREDGAEPSPARRRDQGLDTRQLSGASALLPEGDLPWSAPGGTSQVALKPMLTTHKSRKPSRAIPDAAKIEEKTAMIQRLPEQPVDPEARRVLDALGAETRHIDELCRSLDMNVAALSGLLTLLEVRGLVKRAPGMLYSLPEDGRGRA